LTALRHQENIVMPEQQKNVALLKVSETESALMQADAAISEYSQKIADTELQLIGTQPRVVTLTRTSSNQYSVERLHTMLEELQNRRTQLLAKYRSDERMVQEVDQELVDTRASLETAKKLTGMDESTDVNPVYRSLQLELVKERAELAGICSR